MSRFKPGPTKLRNGDDAVIYEVTDNWIYGRSGLQAMQWSSAGASDEIEAFDIMPPEPERVVFEALGFEIKRIGAVASEKLSALEGKRVRVTVEVIE